MCRRGNYEYDMVLVVVIQSIAVYRNSVGQCAAATNIHS